MLVWGNAEEDETKLIGRTSGQDIEIDNDGNVYITGTCSGMVDFDPGDNRNVQDVHDGIFLSKHDPNGNLIWVKTWKPDEYDISLEVYPRPGIALDSQSNIYLTSAFGLTWDLDPGDEEIKWVGDREGAQFLCKLDPEGNLMWEEVWNKTGCPFGWEIHITAIDEILLTGNFSGKVDFARDQYDTTLTSYRLADSAFIGNFNTDGELLWIKSWETTGIVRPKDMTSDKDGNIYIVGGFKRDLIFEDGFSEYTHADMDDVHSFILKFSESGEILNTYTWGGDGSTDCVAVDAGPNGSIWVTGSLYGSMKFDTTYGSPEYSSPEHEDSCFFAEFDNDLKFKMVITWEGDDDSSVRGRDILAGNDGQIYILSDLWGTADFNPDAGKWMLDSSGSYMPCISVFDHNGMFKWADSNEIGGWLQNYHSSLCQDDEGNIFITGSAGPTAFLIKYSTIE